MRYVPFTVHIRIVPTRGSGQLKTKRFETWRDMQKIAVLLYDGIRDIQAITPAIPGGGQHTSSTKSERGGLGGMAHGMAVKPQIGGMPAQAMLTGFYRSPIAKNYPHPDITRISGNEIWTGSRVASFPKSQNIEVAVLKADIEIALDANLPPDIEYQIFRIDYAGVVYGDKGNHFPRLPI